MINPYFTSKTSVVFFSCLFDYVRHYPCPLKLGRLEEAKNLLAELDTKYPGFSQDIPGEFAKLHLPADFARFVDETISEIR